MFCIKCGQKLPNDAKFCMKCGSNLQVQLNPSSPPVQIVPAKCTSCGGTLTLNPNEERAICPFCESSFIVKQAIQNYNISVQASTINIANASVQTGPSVNNLLSRANEFLSKSDFDSAKKYYEQVLDFDITNAAARSGLETCDKSSEYAFYVYRVRPQITELSGCVYYFSVFYKSFLIEEILGTKIRKTRTIQISELNKIGRFKKANKVSGIYFEFKNGTDYYLDILEQTEIMIQETVDLIKQILNGHNPPFIAVGSAEITQGKNAVKQYLRTHKFPLFTSKETMIGEAAYEYMKATHTYFKHAIVPSQKAANEIGF